MAYFWLLSLPQRVQPSPIDQAPHQLLSSLQETRWENKILPHAPINLFVIE